MLPIQIGLNIGNVLSERSHSVLLQASEILRIKRSAPAVNSATGAVTKSARRWFESLSKYVHIIILISYLTIFSFLFQAPVEGPPPPVPMESQWIRNAIHMTANSIGLSVAYFMQKTAVTFGGCTMGSEYLLITFEDLIDPLLSKLSLPTLKRKRYTNKSIYPQVCILSYLIIFQRMLPRNSFCRAPWSLLVSTAKWEESPLGRKVPSWGSYSPLLWWLRHAYRRMCLLLCLKMSELLSLLTLICCSLG